MNYGKVVQFDFESKQWCIDVTHEANFPEGDRISLLKYKGKFGKTLLKHPLKLSVKELAAVRKDTFGWAQDVIEECDAIAERMISMPHDPDSYTSGASAAVSTAAAAESNIDAQDDIRKLISKLDGQSARAVHHDSSSYWEWRLGNGMWHNTIRTEETVQESLSCQIAGLQTVTIVGQTHCMTEDTIY